jgi:sortase (surface protein transpeptidase)
VLSTSSVFALTPKEQKWVKTLTLPSLEWQSPDWFTPFSLAEAPEHIDYWKSLLPEQDRFWSMYIVMPTLWMVSPVIIVPEWSTDAETMKQWKEIDINKYLVDWVLHYPWTAMPDQVWNIVIFGHSNFYKNRGVRYPSIFADIMNLDAIRDDEIWLFTLKNDGKNYELYKYAIEKSYDTKPTDVGILEPNGWKELTVFACTNGLAWRWILKARQIPDNELLVPWHYKTRLWNLTERLAALQQVEQERIRDIVSSQIASVREKAQSVPQKRTRQMRIYLLNYLEETIENLRNKS